MVKSSFFFSCSFEKIRKISIFVEMEKMKKIVSVVMLALMCCVTVFQCHHHDDAGHAFFLTYSDAEITINGQHDDCCHHDCQGTQGDEASVCGMHLTEAMTITKTQSHFEDFSLWSYVIADCAFDMVLLECYAKDVCLERGVIGTEIGGFGSAMKLRGPPAWV